MLLETPGPAHHPIQPGGHGHQDLRGWIASGVLHALLVCFVLALARHAVIPHHNAMQLIPVHVVQLAEQTSTPAAQHRAAIPERRASPSKPAHPRTVARPNPERPSTPSDAVEARIRRLSSLHEQDASLPALDTAGVARTGDAAGDAATYSVRDYVRNQVERRWNINLVRLSSRRVVVELYVALKADGTVSHADIVDKERFATDAAWRDIALSARNAVLLSSPISFPGGLHPGPIDVMLRLEPRDMLR